MHGLRCVMLAMLVAVSGCGRSQDGDPATEVVVFAAASTTDVMREAGRKFEDATGTKVLFNFAASSTLAQQIRSGARADVFLSASAEWMDEAERNSDIISGSRIDLLGNSLVLIAPVGNAFEIDMAPAFDFPARLPEVRRIAMGDPAHVPAGRYAKAALESLGWWDAMERLIIPAVDVRAALRLVEIGEVDAGVVYASDAAQSNRVVIIAAFPPETHEPIVYPAALCRGAGPDAEAFLAFLRHDAMTQVFEQAGFAAFAE